MFATYCSFVLIELTPPSYEFCVAKYILKFLGDPSRRSVLPDHEAVDREPKPVVRGTGLGTDVAGHRPLCLLPEPHEGPQPVPEDAQAPHSHGLHPAAAEDDAARPEEVPAPPGRGGGHPAQDNPDIPQSLLPR